MQLSVDGRRVGSARGVNTPGEWLPAGEVRLVSGAHEVKVTNPGGSLRPGDRYVGELGPVAFERREPERLLTASPSQAGRRLCGRTLDWLELTR